MVQGHMLKCGVLNYMQGKFIVRLWLRRRLRHEVARFCDYL